MEEQKNMIGFKSIEQDQQIFPFFLNIRYIFNDPGGKAGSKVDGKNI